MGWPRPLNHRSRRLVRLAVWGTAAAAAAASSWFLVIPLAARALVRGLEMTLNGSLLLAASLGSTADTWTVARTLAHAIGAMLLTKPALIAVTVLLLVAAMALYGLQRLLGTEEESSR